MALASLAGGQSTIVLGPEALVQIMLSGGQTGNDQWLGSAAGGTFSFGCISGNYSIKAERAQGITDTNNVGQTRTKCGLRTFTLEFEGQHDSAFNPHSFPFFFRSGQYIAVWVWPNFVTGGATYYYYCPYFNLGDFESNFRVPGSDSQKITFRGESDGKAYYPNGILI